MSLLSVCPIVEDIFVKPLIERLEEMFGEVYGKVANYKKTTILMSIMRALASVLWAQKNILI